MDPETLLEVIRLFAVRLTATETQMQILADQNEKLRAAQPDVAEHASPDPGPHN